MSQSPSPWRGRLELDYQRRGGQTLLASAYAQAPFKIQKAFYPEGSRICHTAVLHTAGGMVGGDYLSQKIDLAAHCQALITTPSAAKVYGHQKRISQQEVEINLSSGSCLEFLPQETILYNQAQYRQSVRVNLADGAAFLGWEIYRLGRTARGETFRQGQWRSAVEVWSAGVPLWIDRQTLPGDEFSLAQINALGGQTLIGALYFFGAFDSQPFLDPIRQCWRELNPQGEGGVTELQGGLLCRYRGADLTEVKRWFWAVWALLRRRCWGLSPVFPRVWPLLGSGLSDLK
ncbi:MAG: urease accessory protein UreD [Cyanobacteriota bacterium]|jgi:urease accessory protein